MPTTIPIAGLAANDPVPGVYNEIDFAAGPNASSGAVYAMLIIGNKLSTGTATADTVVYGPDTAVSLTSLADAATLFGIGSEAYRMYKRALPLANLASVPVYVICPTESVGAKATGTITLATTAAANGVLRVFVADEFVDVTITSGDTADTIKTAAITAINAKTDWPCVASSGGTGIITLTAQQKGLRGNWIRYGASVIGNGVNTTSSQGPMAFMTGGTTSDTWTTALATIAASRYYYIAPADDGGQSATGLTALMTQVTSQALPLTGITQVVIAGAVDATLSNVTTVAVALNNARGEMYHLPKGDVPPCELAAMMAATEAAYEASFSASVLNFDAFGSTVQSQPYWRVPAPRVPAPFTRTQLISALNNGVSPIQVDSRGKTFLVSRITTRSQTSSVADYRIRDSHKVRIMDRYADDLRAKQVLQTAGKVIANDPAPGEKSPGAAVVTPRIMKALVNKLTRDYGDADLFQNTADIVAGTIVNRESSPTTRMTTSVPAQPIDCLHQIGNVLAQVA